jgi:hypothetical protein
VDCDDQSDESAVSVYVNFTSEGIAGLREERDDPGRHVPLRRIHLVQKPILGAVGKEVSRCFDQRYVFFENEPRADAVRHRNAGFVKHGVHFRDVIAA